MNGNQLQEKEAEAGEELLMTMCAGHTFTSLSTYFRGTTKRCDHLEDTDTGKTGSGKLLENVIIILT